MEFDAVNSYLYGTGSRSALWGDKMQSNCLNGVNGSDCEKPGTLSNIYE